MTKPQSAIEEINHYDPQPRRGFREGDLVRITVDPYGLSGRDPHPPIIREKDTNGMRYGMPYSPITLGVVAYYDKAGTDTEWECGDTEGDYLPPNYYYCATPYGFYVFADYEMSATHLGCIDNLPEPYGNVTTHAYPQND